MNTEKHENQLLIRPWYGPVSGFSVYQHCIHSNNNKINTAADTGSSKSAFTLPVIKSLQSKVHNNDCTA